MSVYANTTNATPANPYFVLNDNQVDFLSTISIFNGTIQTSQINLDGVQMDCSYLGPLSTPTLFLNGAPVASVSSFTSSVVTWASYPALNTITYAGAGGAANLANVNALTQISTASAVAGTVNANNISTGNINVSTINGVPFTTATGAVRSVTGSPIVNGGSTVVDFGGLPSGFYLLTVYISSGGLDPFSCSTVVSLIGGNVVGGTFHCPSIQGAPPSLLNCVSIQDNGAGSSQLTVFVYATSPVGLGAVPQINVYSLN